MFRALVVVREHGVNYVRVARRFNQCEHRTECQHICARRISTGAIINQTARHVKRRAKAGIFCRNKKDPNIYVRAFLKTLAYLFRRKRRIPNSAEIPSPTSAQDEGSGTGITSSRLSKSGSPTSWASRNSGSTPVSVVRSLLQM